jgi:hypothetical protein
MRNTPTSSKTLFWTENQLKESESCTKLTYEQWLERKSEQYKLAKKIEKELKRQEDLKKKEAEEENYKKTIMSEEKFKEWKKNKILQLSSAEKIKLQNKYLQENMNKTKQIVAKEKYQEWLRSSLKSLKKLKIVEKKEKIKQDQEKKRKEAEKKMKLEKSRQMYELWLEKKTQTKKSKPKKPKKIQKPKKIIMLAYSPNRKKSPSLSSIDETVSENIHSSTMISNTSSEQEKLENPIFLPENNKKRTPRRSDDYQAFDELSSIHKSNKVQSIFHSEEEVESFMSELENNDIV